MVEDFPDLMATSISFAVQDLFLQHSPKMIFS